MDRAADRHPGLQVAVEPPPLSLPAEHLVAAGVCFAIGALVLVAIAPQLAAGLFFLPTVIAAVHLFTLGWIALSIFGALCQFLPVAIGRRLRWEPLAHVTFGLHVLGVATFVAGLTHGDHALTMVGAGALTCSFVLFAVNLGATLASAPDRSVTWWALWIATVFLIVTPIYGTVLALDLHDGRLGAARFAVIATHAHIAIAGIVLPVIVGVAHRLIPMFVLSHGASELPARVSVALLFTGAALLAVPVAGLHAAAAALVAAGVVAFAVQAALFFRRRMRRTLDPGMRLAAAGIVGLIGAVALAPFMISRGFGDVHLLAAYFVVLLGAIAVFIAGHYFKIVPFLVWYHRFGPLVGARPVPKVSELFSARAAHVAAALLVVGWLGLSLGTYQGSVVVVRTAAASFLAGGLLEAVILSQVAGRRPA
jgi:hypothetical protein